MSNRTCHLTDVTQQTHNLLHTVLPKGNKHIWDDLRGACAIGAFSVRFLLWREHRIRASIVGDSLEPDHVWVKVGDVHLDPTYQQFDADRPYLVTEDHHLGDGVVLSELPVYWPIEQHPVTYWQALGFGVFLGPAPNRRERRSARTSG